MRTYFYIFNKQSTARGYNRTLAVYELFKKELYLVGVNNKIIAGCSKGSHAEACMLISKEQGLKMSDCGYFLKREEDFSKATVRVRELFTDFK